jgi:hypothetical protein
MLQTNTTSYPSGLPLNRWEAPSSRRLPTDERVAVRRERQRELAIDETLAESFPASDPPAWNPGLARPIPAGPTHGRANDIRRVSPACETASDTPGVIDLARPDLTLVQALLSLSGAVGLALLVPFAILLVGLPVALAVRGLLEVVLWLFRATG